MPRISFEWDPRKAASNLRKHGISFTEASTVFDDPLVLLVADWEQGEPRIVAIGTAQSERVLFVVIVEIEGDAMRIVTARRATRRERQRYEEDQR